MAENEAAVAEQEQEFEYPIRIEDAGPGTKKVSVEIPHERITSELEKQFKELRQQAAIPGFRPGHAPQKLIEKRFSSDVKEQVRRSLISESYGQAVEKNNLQVIGEPEFDNPDAIKLPEDGALSYSFTVEVQPEFTLPDLSGLKIKKPKIEIKEENVDQAMQNLREQQGTLVPVEDRGLEKGDYLTADVHVKQDGNVIAHQHDAQLVVRPGRVAGLEIDDLDTQLAGMKPGETRTISVTVPDTYPNEQLRGKQVEIEIALKDFKKLELAEVTPEFLQDLGFDNEKDLRDALREQMEEKIQYDVQQAMREQVNRYLLDNTNVELPTRLSDKQTDRIISRRAVDLMMRGMPRDQVEMNIERLRHGARDEAVRELKLFFILQKLAAQENVDVDEAELNGRIAMLAAQSGRRPEKVKQEMAKDGTLANMYVQMREQKAVDRVLEKAQIEEVDLEEEQKKE
ncbi:MAG TPA: trigger factor [Tepidisphaeraceae bacterium]|nr:trigger factor [Tepidisphaeraceae bacterium]